MTTVISEEGLAIIAGYEAAEKGLTKADLESAVDPEFLELWLEGYDLYLTEPIGDSPQDG